MIRLAVRTMLCAATLLGASAVAAPLAVGADATYTATLSPASEVPPVTSQGAGNAYFFLSADQHTLSYTVSYSGLTGALAHAEVRWGANGVIGPTMFKLPVAAGTLFGKLTVADVRPTGKTWAQVVEALHSGAAYVNLATAGFHDGEVRGQVQEVPAGATPSPGSTAARTQPPTDEALPLHRGSPRGTVNVVAISLISLIGSVLAVAAVRPTPRRSRRSIRR